VLPPIDFPSDVEVAIVAHDNLSALPGTLASLAGAACPPDAITIVDVASTDGTPGYLAREWPLVRVKRLDSNEGPNPARNIGLTQATRPFVFLMDADVRVMPETVQRLRAAMQAEPGIKVASPIVVHAARPDCIQYAGGALHYMCEAINPWMDRPVAERGSAPLDIGSAPACGLLIDRSAALSVGLFDERYFLGKDDGDFMFRMRVAGHRISERPDALVLHASRPRGRWMFYYQIRNRWHFMLKNYQWRTLVTILPCLMIHEPLQLVVLHLQGHGAVYWKAVGGVFAMLPALPRDRALMRRIRLLPDRAVLGSDALVVRDDMLRSPLVRRGKRAYEIFLRGYWHMLTRTVLAG
jgi:GT2 family glycosyltransferase